MSGERRSGERRSGGPTPEAIEALVRAIQAKEANEPAIGAEAALGDQPAAGDDPATRPATRTVQRQSSNAVRPRSPAPAGRSGAPAGRSGAPVSYRAPGSPPTPGGPIPGLVGRQAWEASLAEEAERQQRYGHPLSIIIAELEGQEPEPTAMGTAMIGRMAPRCAAILLALARASDRVTRLSGSRFGVLLLEADEEAAGLYVDRAAAACEPWLAASAVSMQLSIGWAVARGPEELVGALRTAEERLRAAD